MIELVQNLIDGLGRGSIYALLALGVAVVFGVMHLLNFAHGEMITVSGYAAYAAFTRGWSWYLVVPLIIVVSIVTSLVIERVAFSRVRGASEFTLLLTSFGIHFLVSAIFLMYVGARVKTFPEPSWINDTFSIGALTVETFDLVVIAVTLVVLAATTLILQRTMFGLALRAAAEDFDTARMMGVNSDMVIRGSVRSVGCARRCRCRLLADARRQHEPGRRCRRHAQGCARGAHRWLGEPAWSGARRSRTRRRRGAAPFPTAR